MVAKNNYNKGGNINGSKRRKKKQIYGECWKKSK